MASTLLASTAPGLAPNWVGEPGRLQTQSARRQRINEACGRMLAELAGVPRARHMLFALAASVRNSSVPASALIESDRRSPPDAEHVNEVLWMLAQVRQLDRRMAMLRVRASCRRDAAAAVACRYETARLTDATAAILSGLPISRALVRALAAELLTLDDRLERASRRLAEPADIDLEHAIERHVGLRAEAFRERCARLRRAQTRFAALEQHQIQTSWEASKGQSPCVSEMR